MPFQRILIIDDDTDVCALVASTALAKGTACIIAANAEVFFAELAPDINLIFLDLLMPKVDGVEVLRRLAKMKCTIPIVLVSGVGARILETAISLAKSLGLTVAGQLRKPFRLAELEAFLEPVPETKTVAAEPRMKTVLLKDHELISAIENNEFVLHYQPQIQIATGEVVGLEALVRWQHPLHGIVYPDNFISRCERLDLIDQLGTIVAARGLSEIGQFKSKSGKPLILSINVSAFSLLDLSFPDTMMNLARQHNKDPEEVTLEITESGLIRDLRQTLDVLARLRMKGFQISIDDFGTGYSMMQQLRTIPATEIKIDRSFVMNIQNKSDSVMVLKTIEIGHELGLMVLAEGVETEKDLEFLRTHGCDLAQGYLFSRPLPPEDLTKWLAARYS